ncbi:MAG: class I SAM-dependent methyltransferase [Candidatus Acidiferrum sp.]
MASTLIFDQQHYDLLNRSRGEVVSRLLGEVKQPLGLHTAVDVGCGLGHFSGLLRSLGFDVTGVDGRKQNVEEAQRRNPGVRFSQFDAEDPGLRSLGKFDLVFCFGLLYHLENPLLTIRHLRAMTTKLLLVEGVIFPGDEPVMALVDEGATEDQGLDHFAFYPTEACLIKMLWRAGFPHVYGFATQPDHAEYRSTKSSRRIRTVLAASTDPLSSALLNSVSEPKTEVVPWDPTSGMRQSRPLEKLRSLVRGGLPRRAKAGKV